MGKGAPGQQSIAPDVAQLIEQLERHCLAPDGSYLSKSAYSDLQQARDEMSSERGRYLEALAVYNEALAMVEEYHQSGATGNLGGGGRDYAQFGLRCSPKVYESLEHRLVVAEAAQRLRLPLLSKDGELNEEEIEKLSTKSRTSFDSATTSMTLGSNSNLTSYSSSFTNSSVGMLGVTPISHASDIEIGIGGAPNRFVGVTPDFLWSVQEQQPAMALDEAQYQSCVVRVIESYLEAKCDSLADVFAVDDNDSTSITHISSARLPEKVKLIIDKVEKEEAMLLEDLYSMDRKYSEHYNILEQILGVLIKFVKDLMLQHQHQYDELKKTWLCKRCQTMDAKLRVLESLILRDTYTKDTVPALHRIRKYLLEATEEASITYNKAITRLREYQGVDPHFDTIASQYQDIVKKLESLQWTIHQVEMDLQHPQEHVVS